MNPAKEIPYFTVVDSDRQFHTWIFGSTPDGLLPPVEVHKLKGGEVSATYDLGDGIVEAPMRLPIMELRYRVELSDGQPELVAVDPLMVIPTQ